MSEHNDKLIDLTLFIVVPSLLFILFLPSSPLLYFTLLYSFHIFYLSVGLSVLFDTPLLRKRQLALAECNVPSNEIRFGSPTALRTKITVFRDLTPCTSVVTRVPNCLGAFLLYSSGRQSVKGWRGGGVESSKILRRSVVPTEVQAWQPRIITAKLIYLWYYYYYYSKCCDVVYQHHDHRWKNHHI
jgi:hypothetical protein